MNHLIVFSVLLLIGCGNWQHQSPEEMGKKIKACQAVGLDYTIGDWSAVYCIKPVKKD